MLLIGYMGGKSPAVLERGDYPKIGSAVGIINCLLFILFFPSNQPNSLVMNVFVN